MNDALANLLGLYAGLLLMNTLISGFMWWTSKSPLNRDLTGMWAAMLFGFLAQGAASAFFEPAGTPSVSNQAIAPSSGMTKSTGRP